MRQLLSLQIQNLLRKPPEETGRFFLQDERDPDSLYQIDEDEHGSYIMNAKDLKLIDFLKPLQDAGSAPLKLKDEQNLFTTYLWSHRAYRRAIDDMVAGKEFDPQPTMNLIKSPTAATTEALWPIKPIDPCRIILTKKKFFAKFAGMVRADNEF